MAPEASAAAAATAAEGLLRARQRSYTLAVLDYLLPDGSGLDLCREVRAAGNTPVLMLSARGEELDRVLGLELGADDYLAKPFSMLELLARVRALLRRIDQLRQAPAGNALGQISYEALLAEGGLPEDPAAYVKRVNALLS